MMTAPDWLRRVPARVLLSIDYEPWYAFGHRYDRVVSTERRKALDAGFTRVAADEVLEQLGAARVTFFLAGEIADWYPEVPQKIVDGGHELGLHCQVHRSLVNASELAADIRSSAGWRSRFPVRGYRAPMVGISEQAYPLLHDAGFLYSSSIYAGAGTLIRKDGVWEVPVSTARLAGRQGPPLVAPRDFSLKLLLGGEIPYGSSFTIGLLGDAVFRLMEEDLGAGLSPVIVLHPHELAPPEKFVRRTLPDVLRQPLYLPFVFHKGRFLARLLERFPVSPLGSYLDEALRLQPGSHA